MAASLANIVKVTGSSTTSVTTSTINTATSGSTFGVSVSRGPGVTATVSDNNSNTFTQLGTTQNSGGAQNTDFGLYVKENGTGRTGHTATIGFSVADFPVCYFFEITGAASASVDTAARVQGTDSATPFTITTGTFAQANNLVMAFFNPGAPTGTGTLNPAESTGFTNVGSETNWASFNCHSAWTKSVTATTALTPSFTDSGSAGVTNAGLNVVAFKEASLAPTINKSPQSVSIQNNEYTQLQVFATTSGGALSYQWQDNRGGSFANCSDGTGATSQFYDTARLTTANSGRQYRCAVTDSNGTTNSSAATITVVNGGTANLGRWGPELRIDAWF